MLCWHSPRVGLLVASLNFTPTDEAEVTIHFATERDFVADLTADELCEQNTCLFLYYRTKMSEISLRAQIMILTPVTRWTLPPHEVEPMLMRRVSPS